MGHPLGYPDLGELCPNRRGFRQSSRETIDWAISPSKFCGPVAGSEDIREARQKGEVGCVNRFRTRANPTQ